MSSSSHKIAPPPIKQWLLVAFATGVVSGGPIAVVWWLRASGTVSSVIFGVSIGMILSLGASFAGRLLWERHPASEDLLFSDLMVWGYLHRRRVEHRLASAVNTLGPMSAAQGRSAGGLSVKEQAKRLEGLVACVETRDPYLHGHSRRVARYSWMIAGRMGLSREEVARIRTAAAIHDVGKIETPKEVLHKPSRLNDEEYAIIKRHPGDGAQMTEALHDPALTAMVRHHHERLDGTGYPDSLAGENIPLGARIIAVADTFDAITSSRPYRSASAHRKAIEILQEESGTRLDTAVVRAFTGHYAGRRPLVIWASLTSLPERIVSVFWSAAGGVASAAKVAAVATLIGVTAATSSLALPAPSHARRTKASLLTRVRGGADHAPAAAQRTRKGSSVAAPAGGASQRHRRRSAAGPSVSRSAGTAAGAAPGAAGTGSQAQSSGGGQSQSAQGPAGSSEASGKDPARTSESSSGSSSGSGSGVSGKTGETGETAKGETPRTSTPVKSEEAKGKSEESKGKSGKSEEGSTTTPAKEESKGVVKEVVKEVGGKTKEVTEVVKEVTGKTKEVVKETGKEVTEVVKEVGGKTKEVLGILK